MTNRPDYLHLYLSYDDAIELLKESKLRMKSPASFNDPFEFLPQTTYSRNLINNDWTINSKQEIMEIFSNNGLVKVLTRPVQYIKKLSHINVIKKRYQIINLYKICCLSEVNDNILMWSHYTRKHTGVLITFKTAWDFWENNLLRVEYSDKRVKVPFIEGIFTDKDVSVFDKWQWDLLITKSLHWSYEKEWRYIKKNDSCKSDTIGYYSLLNKNSISSITLGCKMSSENCKEITSIIKERYPSVTIYKAIPDDNEYALKFISEFSDYFSELFRP